MDEVYEEPRRSSGAFKVVLGCLGCSVALVLAIGAVVALNWGAIEERVQQSMEHLAELGDVQAVLIEELDCQVSIHSVHSGRTSTLSIGLEGLDPDSQDARAIALIAVRAHPDPEAFDAVAVRFVEQSRGVIVSTSSNRGTTFQMDDLLAEER